MGYKFFQFLKLCRKRWGLVITNIYIYIPIDLQVRLRKVPLVYKLL